MSALLRIVLWCRTVRIHDLSLLCLRHKWLPRYISSSGSTPEDYVEIWDPIYGTALRIATDLSRLNMRATFKVVGEKAWGFGVGVKNPTWCRLSRRYNIRYHMAYTAPS